MKLVSLERICSKPVKHDTWEVNNYYLHRFYCMTDRKSYVVECKKKNTECIVTVSI